MERGEPWVPPWLLQEALVPAFWAENWALSKISYLTLPLVVAAWRNWVWPWNPKHSETQRKTSRGYAEQADIKCMLAWYHLKAPREPRGHSIVGISACELQEMAWHLVSPPTSSASLSTHPAPSGAGFRMNTQKPGTHGLSAIWYSPTPAVSCHHLSLRMTEHEPLWG